MVLFIILGVVVILTFIVLGSLFFILSKEGIKKEEKAVPLTDLKQIKEEFSSGLLEQEVPKVSADGPEVIPAFIPKVSLPTQEVKSPLEDDTYKKRAQELEEELRAIKQKAEEQSDVARQMILDLTKENQSLKDQQTEVQEAQAKLTELEGEASSLKIDNANLQNQLESTNTKVRLLEEEMAAVKIKMEEKIAEANATVTELKKEQENVLPAAPAPVPDEAQRQELESLKAEHIQLKQKLEDLQKAHQELVVLNTQQTDKNDQMQYELIKARAQSSGLERISFNYKNQLEDFLKKINAVQVTNDNLSQVKNRLEGMVQEVKSQNEELAQKDQLAQFELEKNRSRLLTLEREYEDLKAKVQQQNQ